ncbi:hypothetical protein ACIRP3_18270 [Streptomyces sp. NPDC101209]|uniref:hypothetical protein n=1 Tax=Streptomyces sp. NPDC101209 TaxID=3366129 RepID=UPI003825D00C
MDADSLTGAWAGQITLVVGRDDKGDLAGRAVNKNELVEVAVHTSPVMNCLITELAEVVKAIGCGQAVGHLPLQICPQLDGPVAGRLHPLSETVSEICRGPLLVWSLGMS